MFDERTKENLKYYVYLLIDPENNEPFYVGKGKNNRIFAHINQEIDDDGDSLKYAEIRRIGPEKVKHVIVRHGLSEKESFAIEASLIDTFRYIPSFLRFVRGNIQGGFNSIEKGLMTSNEIIQMYNAQPLEKIEDDCLIININKSYKRGSGIAAIYNATKETWRIKESRREKVKYVLSEYKGLIVEVFKVDRWYPKERGFNPGAKKYGQTYTGYGFEGTIADNKVRDKYINKTISQFKKRGFGGVLIFPETLEKLKNE